MFFPFPGKLVTATTPDDSAPQREAWDDAGEHYFHVLATDEQGLTEGIPERLESMSQVGQSPLGYGDYQVRKVITFEPLSNYQQGFDQIWVCVCLPVAALVDEAERAIAA